MQYFNIAITSVSLTTYGYADACKLIGEYDHCLTLAGVTGWLTVCVLADAVDGAAGCGPPSTG